MSLLARVSLALALATVSMPTFSQDGFYYRNIQGSGARPGNQAPPTPGGNGQPVPGQPAVQSISLASRAGRQTTLVPTASGFEGPVTWSIQGSPPPGMGFDSATGSVTGVPSAPGTFSYQVRATAGAASATANVTLTVAPALVIQQVPSLSARVGVPFSHAFSATGAVGEIQWTFSSGAPGQGSNGGTFGFTPTQPGNVPLSAYASDSDGGQDSVSTSVSVTGPTVSVTDYVVVTVGETMNVTASPSGLTGSPTWSLVDAPSGMTVSAAGTVTWTPQSVGTFPGIRLQVVDADGSFGFSGSMSVRVDPLPLAVVTTSLASATRGAGYSQTLSATGGVAPVTWAEVCQSACTPANARLPAGLHLDRATGTLNGTPTETGTFAPVFTAVDKDGRTASRTLSFVVDAPAVGANANLLAAVSTTASNGYVQLNGSNVAPTDAAGLLSVAKASPSSYSFYGLLNGQSVTYRYSQPVAVSRFAVQMRHLEADRTLVIETSLDGSNWTQVHSLTISSSTAGAVPDQSAGGHQVGVNVPLTTATTATYARVRYTSGSGWIAVGPGGFQ